MVYYLHNNLAIAQHNETTFRKCYIFLAKIHIHILNTTEIGPCIRFLVIIRQPGATVESF